MKTTSFLCFILIASVFADIDLTEWELFDTNINYLSIQGTTMWMTSSSSPNTNGFLTYAWDTTNARWTSVQGSCVQLSVGNNYVYCRDQQYNVYRRSKNDYTATAWTQVSITANDIKVGANNDIFYCGRTNSGSSGHDYNIDQYVESTGTDTVLGGGALKIGPTADAKAWVVNYWGNVYYRNGGWNGMPGSGMDIITGSDNVPVMLTMTTTTGGYTVQRWDSPNNQWVNVAGIGGVALALDARNNIYVVTSDNKVYRQMNVVVDFCPICKITCSSCADAATCQKCQQTLCLSNNQCKVCPGGTYPQTSSGTCATCANNCNTCTSSGTCLSCSSTRGLSNGQCVTPCPPGTYLLNNVCTNCPSHCTACTDGSTCQSCSTNYGLSNNLCVTCPSGTYLSSGTCTTCPTQCATCTDGSTCQSCQSGYGLSGSSCVTCSSGTYLSNGVCQTCPNTCATCTGANTCQSCKTNYGLSNSMCVTCPSNTYLSSGTCTGCPTHCATCTDGSTCQSCQSGYGLVSSQCVTCSPGTYLSSGTCATCPNHCATCTSASTCQSCTTNYGLYNNLCVTCPGGTYLSSGNCNKCPDNCATCTDSNTCQSCTTSAYLSGHQCIACGSGKYSTGSACAACSSNCVTCSDANTCQKCENNFGLQNAQCTACPAGMSSSGTTCESPKKTESSNSGLIVGATLGSVVFSSSALGLVFKLYRRRKLRERRVQNINETEAAKLSSPIPPAQVIP